MASLDHLLEEKGGAEKKRRVQTSMKSDGFTAAMTIDGYDFLFHWCEKSNPVPRVHIGLTIALFGGLCMPL